MSRHTDHEKDIEATFLQAEQTGLKLAIKGRLVAIVLMGIWLASTRGSDRSIDFIAVATLFAVLGMIQFALIGTHFNRPWHKYLFLFLDAALLSVLVAIAPVIPSADLPQSFIFRVNIFPYYFLLLAISAFSFSPGLVLWAGFVGSAGWLAAFQYIFSQTPSPLTWTDMGVNPNREQFLSVFFDPRFLPISSRIQETIILFIVAALLAVVMRRTRNTVFAHLTADAERRSISDMFGRYVPKAVAEAMISDQGVLAPIERTATVVFIDIAGFTALTERLGPAPVTAVLNAYFDDATEIIGSHGGVITQFQGDAILAIFNVPIVDQDHAHHALQAVLELLQRVKTQTYGGQSIAIRAGINTGNLIAGNIGGGGRQTYTVHGDAVNTAARLEVMNKELGTSILLSGATAELLGGFEFDEIGQMEIRGLSTKTPVYTIKDRT